MRSYLRLLEEAYHSDGDYMDRTGVGRRGVFGRMLRFPLADGFPLLTTKRIHFHSVLHELLWFVAGERNVKELHKHGVKIWDEWAAPDGDLGEIYGVQWRAWQGDDGAAPIDQLAGLVEGLRTNPHASRHILSAWNVARLPKMALPPCHLLAQFHVRAGEGAPRLSCQMTMRSADIFLGLPFNIASYAALTMMMAQVCGMTADTLIISLGDAHLYRNHLTQAREQMMRAPRSLPRLVLDSAVDDLFAFREEHFKLEGYDPHPHIRAEIAR